VWLASSTGARTRRHVVVIVVVETLQFFLSVCHNKVEPKFWSVNWGMMGWAGGSNFSGTPSTLSFLTSWCTLGHSALADNKQTDSLTELTAVHSVLVAHVTPLRFDWRRVVQHHAQTPAAALQSQRKFSDDASSWLSVVF